MREVTLLDDTRLYVHNEGEAFSDAVIRDRDYFEKEVLDYMAANYPQQDIILDIGANIGNHTVYFSQYLENRTIIAFEPVKENYELLKLNTDSLPNVLIRNEAVGAFRGLVGLTVNTTNMGACEIDATYSTEKGHRRVPQVRVDDLLLIPQVTLMKIDVEWYEPQVLKGAQNILEQDKPLVLMEDAEGVYAELLPPEYELLQAWLAHKTYLYGVPNA